MKVKRRKVNVCSEEEPKAPTTAAGLAKLLREAPECAGAGLRNRDDCTEVAVIPTGIATLDGIIANGRKGKGGVPLARFVVYSGELSAGKTTAALVTASAFQRAGGIVLYIDTERKLDWDWAKRCGVDIDSVIPSYPKTLEDAFEVSEKATREKDPKVPLLIVLDSLNAGTTKEERDAPYGARLYAPQQRVLSQAMARMCDYVEASNTTFLMISQLRSKMDASVTIAGGNSVRFYSILIVTFDGVTKVAEGGKSVSQLYREAKQAGKRISVNVVGTESRISTIKNQVGGPFAESRIRINFRDGVDFNWCLHHEGVERGVIEQSGSWFGWGGRKWQGEAAFGRYVAKRPKFLARLRKAIARCG